MSYQVLARKWRPRSFREMVGQTHVLKALINALDNQRLHHAYLFTGTRGVGKTTIARILAKCLNCETGISSTPCGVCSVCKEIDEGRFIDLIEVDAASRTKVEDTRELLDNVQYMPSRGRYKVYLIDEVHMLSGHSFNALLKTLEEPPPHVKFLLATTDPQKLPVTILSRCLQFSLKNMPPERVVEHLTHVLGVENIPFEADALWLLGRAADGSMRDAMSLTDQAIAFGDGKVLAADVRAMLGTLDHGQVYGVLNALLEGDARALLEAVRHLAEQGPDWNGVLAEILNVLHRVAIAQALPEAVDNGQGDRDRVLALAEALPAEDVQFYYQMGLIGRRDLPLAPEPRNGFEMVLLRMLAFRPADADGAPGRLLKTPGISQATADSAANPVVGVAQTAPVAAPVSVPAAPPVPQPAAASVPAPVAPPPVKPAAVIDLPWDEPAAVAPPLSAAPAGTPVEPDASDDEPPTADDSYYETAGEAQHYLDDLPPNAAQETVEDSLPEVAPATGLAAEWLQLCPAIGLSGMTGSIAANCTLVARDGDNWTLHLDPAHSALFNASQQRRLNDALDQHLGRTIALQIQISKPAQETPAQANTRKRIERQRQAEEAIRNDPLIRQMIEQFGAVIRPDSIEPL
ncbi:DNA polymerase III subunit gamma/tau [Pseudomonas sp. N040]|uniref:DNA polymerase III subunit gamma/tau n=1 Tax=Pseudomonas sp. N040 TaxID=2785325 RepID=UPI0018A32E3F|nr:DNA polymerase III subunit gamma/tau [Pseudomonas sp. N040]MBF7729170.1 DNA polymerase III subunit gamma/tau [Pseudomonas sp. N040]MBW7012810.1 DNA polymerase III subunit gamma/tau [Pseudomonas sp. N040]